MKLNIAPLLLALALAVTPAIPASAHGGAYRGAGDTVPPASGGGSSGSGPSSTGGGGGAPSAGGGGGASAPTSGAPCTLGGTATPAKGPAAPSPASGADLSVWQLWWGFNQAEFLDVKGAIHAMDILPGSDDGFFGSGTILRDNLRPSEAQIRKGIVPALLRALKSERDNDVVTGALVALAKIGDPARAGHGGRSQTRIADTIRPFLMDANQEIAETAAVCLGILGNATSAPHLISLLIDDEHGRTISGEAAGVPLRTRAFAAYGLGLIAHRTDDAVMTRSIARALFTTFDGPARALSTPDVAVACLSALGLVKLPVVDNFDPAHGAQPWSSRQAAVERLAAVSEDARRRDVVRAHAPIAVARLLGEAGGAGAESLSGARAKVIDRWTTALARESLPVDVLWSVAFALGALGDSAADTGNARLRSTLMETSVRGKNRELRQFAIIALAQVATRAGTGDQPLAGLETGRRHVIRQLTQGGSSIRPWAALALGVIGRNLRDAGLSLDNTSDALLIELLDEARAPREVGAYAIAAGMRRIPDAGPVLVRKLTEVADDDTRGYVALALGMLGDPIGLEAVQQVVRRSKYRPTLLRQAAISLGLLGDKAVVPDLIRMLENASSLSAQASIAYGLGSIGDSRSIPPLTAMLEDTSITPRARAFAAVALGIVADKEPRPWNAKLAIGINYRARTATLTDTQAAGILDIL